MRDPLELDPYGRLLEAVFDVIAGMRPGQRRDRAAAAFDERRLSPAFGLADHPDGMPRLVIDVATVELEGSMPLARFEAARFGFRVVDGEIVRDEGSP